MTTLVGKQIAGRYLLASARSGDHPELYEAEDVERGVRVTVVVVRADGPVTPQVVQRAEKLRSIRHPGLVEVLDVGKLDSGELYVAMEQPGGKTLRDATGGKRLAQRRALLIVRQVLDALDTVHRAGQVHGNVHPGNIFITSVLGDERVKLGELGIAKLDGTPTMVDPVYGAPETVRGGIDARADIYAVGAVLFELLTGHPPFIGTDRDALHRLHAYAPVQKLAQRVPDAAFSDALETMIATALAKQRDSRFRTTRDMIGALDRALESAVDPAPAASSDKPALASAASGASSRDSPDDSLVRIMQDLKAQKRSEQRSSEQPPDFVPPASSTERADDSLSRIMQDLKARNPPDEATPDALAVPHDVDRKASELPWPTGRISGRMIVAAIAAIVGLAIVLAVVCSGSGTRRDDAAVASASRRGQSEAEPQTDADPGSAKSSTPAAALDARCEQLANACGDTPKRTSKMIEECKQAATRQAEKGCIETTLAAYDCYEANLCGKADKVWALVDLAVLAQRHATCMTEATSLRTCVGD